MKRWPFAGRRHELDDLVRLARDPTAQGVIIAGPAGVGKSRLAGEVLTRFHAAKVTTLRIRATKAASSIPNGALADLIPPQHPPHLVNTVRWAADELLAQARGRVAVLSVDDAHLLDSHSAEVIACLVRGGQARLVATLRTGEPAPDPVTLLWRDGHVRRYDTGPLSDDDVTAVLTAALGGQPDDATVRRLAEVTEGNALFLSEVVGAAIAAGSLSEIHGMWKLTGAPPLAPRLVDLIHERIGALSPELKDVLEYTALAEPIGARTLGALTGERAVLEAEERGLVRVRVEGRREIARLGHPLYGEVAREHLPELRRRRRHADLAAALEATGLRRREDPLRVTVWRLAGGLGAAPRPLLDASRLAWSAHDYPLAIRLGEAALDAGGGTAAAIQLATLLDYAQQPDRARSVLDATLEPGDEPSKARLVLARASNLAWGMDRLGDALDLLAVTEKELAEPSGRRRLAVQRLGLTASAARTGDALRLGTELLAHDLEPAQRAQVLNSRALALCYAGRTTEATALVREALGAAATWRDELPALVSPLHSTWSMCGYFSGDLAVMDEAIASMRSALAGQRGWSRGEGSLALARGNAATLRGQLGTALLVLHAPANHETALTVGGCMAAYAAAQALRGEADAARDTLRAAVERNRATWTAFMRWVALTRVWIAAAAGESSRAVELALAAAADCRESGLAAFEAVALHDAVRLGAPVTVAARLAELAAAHDGPRVRLAARHAAALAESDADGLLAVAEGFDALGLRLHAAEAAAQAAGLLRRSRGERAARAAATEAWSLAGACQGPDTPALRELAAPDLTERELQVAQLTAAGRSHRQIAMELGIAMRTAMNHRNQAYWKLGVNSPAELAKALNRFRRPAGGTDGPRPISPPPNARPGQAAPGSRRPGPAAEPGGDGR
ncbi:LuxR C-terminal-related transcriptional regulator [Nonomuraea sp. NPDC003804]|uniref:LuxR C-terminal-related transcriptional regulator n=1 Tax=Nonomuraea sp. NPDC003804 TaxID=3154547 RepID=UPI0033B49980